MPEENETAEKGQPFTPEDNAANDEPVDGVEATDEKSTVDEQPFFDPAFEPPEIPEIKKAAVAYVNAKNKRVKATEKETSTNQSLTEEMQKRQDELPRRKHKKSGITYITYPLGDGTEAAIVPSKIKAMVQNVPKPDDD